MTSAPQDPITHSMQRLRVLAAAVVAVLAFGLRPEADAIAASIVLPAVIVASLLALNLVDRLLVAADGTVRTWLVVAQLGCDLLLAVAAPWVLGADAASPAALVASVPILATGLRFRLLGTVVAWLVLTLLLTGRLVLVEAVTELAELGGFAQTAGILLVVALPASYLAEHLAGQLVLTARSRAAAERRAALLGALTEATGALHVLDTDAITEVLVRTPLRLGSVASDLHRRWSDGTWVPVHRLSVAGVGDVLPPLRVDPDLPSGRQPAEASDGHLRIGVSVVEGADQPLLLRTATASAAARLVEEAVDILAAEASIALRNAELHARLDRLATVHEHQARHDPLTGLYNRAGIVAALEDCLAQAPRPPVAVLFVDLDGFKAVNDRHGHRTGDLVLRAVADRLTDAVGDAVLGRLGGDEFVAILHGPDATRRAAEVMARIDPVLTRPFEVGDVVAHVGASCGVATLPPDTVASPEELLDAADRSMYDHKQTREPRASAQV